MPEDDDYGLSPDKETKTIEPPPVEYLPKKPWRYNPPIGFTSFDTFTYQLVTGESATVPKPLAPP